MSSYELVFVVDPRLSDEEVVALSDEYKEMLGSYGARVTKEESWGKRKLAYPIRKLKEGRYLLFEVEGGERNPWIEVHQRMQQNENVLRYLTVRTDRGRLRLRGPEAEQEASDGEPEGGEEKS